MLKKNMSLINCTYMFWDSWLTEETESKPSTGVGILSDSKLV